MSPITTSGFQVSARPGINYLDPGILTPQYSAIIPSVGQGLGAVHQIQQLQDEAAMRPIRQQLAQIQLQDAANRAALSPLDRQLRLAQIAEAEQNAAVPRVVPGSSQIIEEFPAAEDMPAVDEAGERTGPMPLGNLVQISEEQLYGPGGQLSTRQVRKTVKTAAERAVDAQKLSASLKAQEALAASRLRGKQFESEALIQLYNNAVDEGDTEAAALYKARIDRLNAQPGLIAPGVSYTRRIEQLAADAGITLDRAMELANTPEGASALAKAAVANKAAARSPFGAPRLSAQEKELLTGTSPTAAADSEGYAARVNKLLSRSAAIPTLSVTEAIAAPAGTIFIGTDGKKRQKNSNGTVSIIE